MAMGTCEWLLYLAGCVVLSVEFGSFLEATSSAAVCAQGMGQPGEVQGYCPPLKDSTAHTTVWPRTDWLCVLMAKRHTSWEEVSFAEGWPLVCNCLHKGNDRCQLNERERVLLPDSSPRIA